LKTKPIAYLGLGIMGGSMACHLAKAGCNISVWNRSPGRTSEAQAIELGARRANSVADAVSNARIIFICLPDVPDVHELVFTPGGVAESAPKGALIVDMSTIGPHYARTLSTELNSRSLRFMDAPFSGGDVGGRNATLTFIVGGDETDLAEVRPFLELIGTTIRLCGPAGSGQAVKLCNQIMCAVNMLAVCEALKLAEVLAVDGNLVVDVCKSGAGGSWALSNLAPRILALDFDPGFVLDHMINNLRLVNETIRDRNINLPATDLADSLFKRVQRVDATTGKRRGTHAMMQCYTENNVSELPAQ
jgi:3-hydroxyisobutyrate dehydrogenase